MRNPVQPAARSLLALLLLLTMAGCQRANVVAPGPTTLRIGGSTSMEAALRALASEYQAARPEIVFDFRFAGSSVGRDDLSQGRLDLAAVSWQLDGSTASAGTRALPIARDGVAVIVHPKNPVRKLTLLQVKSLYQGEALDWGAVGGETAAEPTIISREDGSGTRSAFEALVMGGERVTLNAVVMPGSGPVADYVAHHPAAVGYVSMAALTDQVRALQIEDIPPAAASVRAGSYHLARTLYILLPEPAPAATLAFVEFILSPSGQAIVARYHVPIK